MTRVYILILSIGIAFFAPSAFAAEEVGSAYKLGFYSRINANIDAVAENIRQKDLSQFPTFQNFGRLCRPPIAGLDTERMDEDLLRELQFGSYTRLMALLGRKHVQLDSTSLSNLTLCLSETYRGLGYIANERANTLSTAGGVGLYSDGNTSNSDYDIVADIERINGILFVDKLDYRGTANVTPESWKKYLAGVNPLSLFGENILWGNVGFSSSPNGTSNPQTGTSSTNNLSNIGGALGQCSSGTIDQSVNNLVTDTFRNDLARVLETGESDPWAIDTALYNNVTPTSSNPLNLSGGTTGDFFHTPPCNDFFCITVSMTAGNQNLLAGGKTYSIEGLIDYHSKFMEPIANSDLSAQKYQTNNYQLPFLNVKLINKISGGSVSIENRPQKTEKRETESTPAELEKQFEILRRCAYVSAGLPSDMNQANIMLGAGYNTNTPDTTSETIQNTTKILGPQNPEDTDIAALCATLNTQKPEAQYYTSISTDLTELEVFSATLVDQIAKALVVDTKLDSLPTH